MSKGIYNSSATRIRPFFSRLSRLDETGGSWLAKLLTAADRSAVWPNESLCSPGRITKIVFETERAGEQAVGPPEAFLAWLLRNPDQMVWPKGKSGDFSPETQKWRMALMGKAEGNASVAQRKAMEEGLLQLSLLGARSSARKWWAFEGSTKVDCYIETEKMCIFVEGKRTEPLSSSTAWFPRRNQFVRNLEAAREHAAGREFGCLLISEKALLVTKEQVAAGLPHFSASETDELLRHYIGNLTWDQACTATGIRFDELPHTCIPI